MCSSVPRARCCICRKFEEDADDTTGSDVCVCVLDLDVHCMAALGSSRLTRMFAFLSVYGVDKMNVEVNPVDSFPRLLDQQQQQAQSPFVYPVSSMTMTNSVNMMTRSAAAANNANNGGDLGRMDSSSASYEPQQQRKQEANRLTNLQVPMPFRLSACARVP